MFIDWVYLGKIIFCGVFRGLGTVRVLRAGSIDPGGKSRVVLVCGSWGWLS